MLVLSRKKNESIRIGDDITVVVVEIRGDKVRLGIEAAADQPVHRQEVYEAIKRAANPDTPTRSLGKHEPPKAQDGGTETAGETG